MTQVTEEMLSAYEKGMAAANNSTVDAVRCAGIQALFDQGLISLPVDEAAIRESVVRECIAALPKAYLQNPHTHCGQAVREAHEAAEKALQSLLPTKDRAKELADEYLDHANEPEGYTQRERFRDFARWLIERGGA